MLARVDYRTDTMHFTSCTPREYRIQRIIMICTIISIHVASPSPRLSKPPIQLSKVFTQQPAKEVTLQAEMTPDEFCSTPTPLPSLGLPLGLENHVMTPNGVIFLFFSFLFFSFLFFSFLFFSFLFFSFLFFSFLFFSPLPHSPVETRQFSDKPWQSPLTLRICSGF